LLDDLLGWSNEVVIIPSVPQNMSESEVDQTYEFMRFVEQLKIWRRLFQIMVPSIVPPSTTTELQFVLNYPVIGFIVIIVIYLVYRYIKKRKREAEMDDGWLEDTTMANG